MKTVFYKLFTIITLSIFLFVPYSKAQRSEGGYTGSERSANGVIKGTVKIESGEVVEYATISIRSLRDSSLISGAISQSDGTFEINGLSYGKYYAEVSFVGFDITRIDNITIRPPNITVDLGEIIISPSAKSIDEVEITADRPHIEYKIDKKVINVSQDISAAGGTAVDVLENVPSIQTDIEGNITLRGSSNFTVYIDGRPSILEGSDALQQIPATAIENIEIITNPSAKYEAEGTGGIINVVMKKRRGQGLNGIVNTSIGTNSKYGTDILLNYRTQLFNFYGGFDYNKRKYSMEASSSEQQWKFDSISGLPFDTTYIERSSEIENNRNGLGFKLGIDYFINDNNTFSISGEYDLRNGLRKSYTSREELLHGVETGFYTESGSERKSDNYELNLDYIRKFNDNGHELTASLNLEGEAPGSGRDEWLKEYRSTNLNDLTTSYRNGDINPEYELRFKTDYVNPFSEHGKVETGIQLDVDQAEYNYYFQELGSDINDDGINDWVDVDSLNLLLNIDRAVYSVYGLYTNRFFWGIDIQGGLRLEYTDRIVKADKDYKVQRPDLFPSLHASKVFDDRNQLMMGYSRRIRRPREWNLNPVRRYWDTENIREGNPELEPEYSDMYEINYQYTRNRSFVAFELYHRHEQNMMERTFKTLSDTINLWTSTNAGERFSTGLEIMTNISIKRMININGSFSIFNDKINSPLQNENTDDEEFSWRARFNTTLNTPWKGRLQINGFYRASGITAQGERDGFFVLNAGYRQDFFDRKLTATIQARDILQSMNFSSISYLENRIIERTFERESPIIRLTLSYKINNYKNRERENGQNSQNGGGMDSSGDDLF